VQRPPIVSGHDFLFGLAGRGERPIGGNGGVTFQLPVESLDPDQHLPGQLNG
jgi:hypothetical protein